MDESLVTLIILLTSFDAAACSQVGLQQEEDEVEEFQLIEKLQRLGINAGDLLWEHPAVHCRRNLLKSIVHLHQENVTDCNTASTAAGDIKKAKEAGYHTCESLLMNTRKVSMH